jgi:NAD+ kinase
MAAQHIGLIANLDKPGAADLLRRLHDDLTEAGHQVSFQRDSGKAAGFEKEDGLKLADLADASDLLIVLGGDGTLLNIAGQLRERIKPLAAVNTGTLGFLTCVTADEVTRLVKAIGHSSYALSKRRMFDVEVQIGHEESQTFTALNEVVAGRGITSRTVHVEVRVDGELVNHYSGDGLIVSTPTGSTAYSMSAGGPIVHPSAPVMVITPVCPHTLTNRAIVVSDDSEIELLIADQRDPLFLTVDGQAIAEAGLETRIRISRADHELPLVMLSEDSFFRVLTGKLNWHGSAVRKNAEGVNLA